MRVTAGCTARAGEIMAGFARIHYLTKWMLEIKRIRSRKKSFIIQKKECGVKPSTRMLLWGFEPQSRA